MYRRHKFGILLLFIVTSLLAYLLDAEYSNISETAIAVVSISLAVYIGAASMLLGSPFSGELRRQQDYEIKEKTQLGVLATYLRFAGGFSLATVTLSSIYVLDIDFQFVDNIAQRLNLIHDVVDTIGRLLSAFECGLFSVNIMFSWLILLFMINSMAKSAPQKDKPRWHN